MSNPMQGVYTVVGMVTGTHVIEDIKTPVPYQVAVNIPADQAHRSRDLWIGIDQKRLFLLKGHSGDTRVVQKAVPALAAPAPSNGESNKLKAELEAAQQKILALQGQLAEAQGKLTLALSDLAEAHQRNTLLQEGHSQKLETIVSMLSRLESGQVSVVQGVRDTLQAVGGDAPVFIPDNIQPKDAETNIQSKKSDVLEGSSVKNAASTLRKLRKKGS